MYLAVVVFKKYIYTEMKLVEEVVLRKKEKKKKATIYFVKFFCCGHQRHLTHPRFFICTYHYRLSSEISSTSSNLGIKCYWPTSCAAGQWVEDNCLFTILSSPNRVHYVEVIIIIVFMQPTTNIAAVVDIHCHLVCPACLRSSSSSSSSSSF